MGAHAGTSPLTQRELIAEYFMEHRVQVLELAAFLDRLSIPAVDLVANDSGPMHIAAALGRPDGSSARCLSRLVDAPRNRTGRGPHGPDHAASPGRAAR